MSEHPYKPQPWRLTDYYPEAYARFMDILGDGIVPDWDDDDHDHNEAQFLADLAAHDAELRRQIATEIAAQTSKARMTWVHEYSEPYVDALNDAARIARGEKP